MCKNDCADSRGSSVSRMPMRSTVAVLVAVLSLPAGAWGLDPAAPFGVTAFVPGTTRWQAMQDARIAWARCDFSWQSVETSQDVFNWATTDWMVSEANARGIHIYAGLGYSPGWASSGGRPQDPPLNSADWYDYVYRCVSRYRDSIHYWELWNEPNLSQFWSGTRSQYINNILKVGADAVHAADPSARVLAPEISSCCYASTWMTDVLNQAGDKIDIICFHQYDGDDVPSGRLAGIDSMRGTIVNAGYGYKDIWVTETGFRSDGGMTEQLQAQYLVDMLKGMETRPWWRNFFWYQIWEGDPGEKWGLLYPNETRKPSWYAYRDYISASAWGPQTPYAGWINVPGRIQAENFDDGGYNVGYLDATGGNSGGQYRATDVDIEGTSDAGGGYNVGWIDSGEWLKYSLNVTAPGTYDVKLRVASCCSGGSFHLELQGKNVSGTRSFGPTGGWQTWTTVTAPNISFAYGTQVLKVVVESGGWNLNWIDVAGQDFVYVDLGNPDTGNGISHVICCDGITVPWPMGGRICRANNDIPDRYMYFNVSDAWAYQGSRPSVTVVVDYFDKDHGNLTLQYDSTSGGAYKNGSTVTFTNTNTWKQATWQLNDAYFGNRQNGGSDFRLAYFDGIDFYLDVIRVSN